MVIFAMQNLLGLNRSHLFIFGFISFALGNRSSPPKKNFYSLAIMGGVTAHQIFELPTSEEAGLGPKG